MTISRKSPQKLNDRKQLGGRRADEGGPLAIFTIVSRNYISYAATLMQSVKLHHRDSERYVFLADEGYDFSELDLPAEVVKADSIGIPDFAGMAFRYTVIELNTAIKPFCVKWLHERYRHVIYLDPDILVLRPLDAICDALDKGASLVLTPHMTRPLQDGKQPDDIGIMKSGVYNLGFGAFGRTPETSALLNWWGDRLKHHCRVDIPNHFFTDQRWMDLAPAFVEQTAIIRHPGYNAAYWNLVHRPITQGADGEWLAAGKPLHFFHFSGVNPLRPDEFSKHQDRFSRASIGGLQPLFEFYVKQLLSNGYERFIGAPYAYASFPDGRKIHWLMRNCFRRLEDNGTRLAGLASRSASKIFDAPDLMAHKTGLPEITRVMYQLWLDRSDLRRSFGLDSPEGRTAYAQWFVERAPVEEGVDESSVRAVMALSGVVPSGAPAAPQRQQASARLTLPWAMEEPWDGPASDARVYLRGFILTTIAGARHQLPRQMAILWERREDLRHAFPLAGADQLDAFIVWCLTDGCAGNGIAPDLIDDAFWQRLDEPLALTGVYDDMPITRGLWLLRGRSGLPEAANFPGDYLSRVKLALWFVFDGARTYHWPPAMVRRLRQYMDAPLPSLTVAGVPLPRLTVMLWGARPDLKTAFDLTTEPGRVGLWSWYVFVGLDEYGLGHNDLPAYVRDALAAGQSQERIDSLLHRLVLSHRDDVRNAFDVSSRTGRRDYFQWWSEFGQVELGGTHVFPPKAGVVAIGGVPASPPADEGKPIVLLTGCASDPSGRGEDVRMTMRALSAQGIPYMTLDRRDRTLRDERQRLLSLAAAQSATVNIVHLNADTAYEDHMFLRSCGATQMPIVGYWAWELAKLPPEYHRAFSFYDEIWAATRFAFEAFDCGRRPVSLLPLAVELPAGLGRFGRPHFHLSENRFWFLFNFDFGSFRARKNPDAVINAFLRAFPDHGERVGLLIKTINAENHWEEWLSISQASKGDNRIVLRNGNYAREEMLDLIRVCDCYVSLHRSEGFGRGPAEAMLLGRPVVATNYSGNVDFMNKRNSFPVDYTLVAVQDGEYPGSDSQVWAEVDIGHAAGQMRRVYSDRKKAQAIGARARRDMQAHFSPAAVGALYRDWLVRFDPRFGSLHPPERDGARTPEAVGFAAQHLAAQS